jgi:hypothetical protein
MISSTVSGDMPSLRAAAEKACKKMDMDPLMMEYCPAGGRNKVENSKAMVERADVYVGIVGWRYGEPAPGYDKSLTELEYEWAGERRIKRIVLVRLGESPEGQAGDQPAGQAARLAAFKDRLAREIIYHEFTTESELREELAVRLHEYERETYRALLGTAFEFLDDRTAGRMQEQSRLLARHYARQVEGWFGRRFAELEAAAAELRTNDPREHAKVLPALACEEKTYPGGVYVLDGRGVVLYHCTPRHPQMNIVNYNAGHREYFKHCSSRLRPVVCNSFRSADRDEDILVLAVPRRDPAGDFIGILDGVVDVSTAPFGDIAERVLADFADPEGIAGHSVTLLLLDERSVVLGSNDRAQTGRNLGGHPVVMSLGGKPDAGGREIGGHGTVWNVADTPFVTVAFWSRPGGGPPP